MVVLAALTFASFVHLFGAELGISLGILVLLHELGHYLTMRKIGVRTSGIFMIPFFGAAVLGDLQDAPLFSEGLVAIAGPLVGLGSSAVLGAVGVALGSAFLLGLAGLNAYITLLNLIPLKPLDGGRVVSSLILKGDFKAIGCLLGVYVAGAAFGVLFLDFTTLTVFEIMCFASFASDCKAAFSGKREPVTGLRRRVLALAYLTALSVAFVMYSTFPGLKI